MSEFTDQPDSEDLDSENGEENTVGQKPISSEFIKLTDDFGDFNADCAFLCDAFAAIINEQEDMNEFTAYGYQRNAKWLKNRVTEFDSRIQQLQRRMRELL
ncbi:hypothetical protein SG34_006025 [Thalassomonas viridans]|uniref:Uncharacterized protein n=1 Tax=Thalassomonas viridans TaxID=137584 RepID=A0AAE9Z4G2_9GAMM|nr:hypothetical protein [Thalassomonas viridans]WDE06475.1 hypothetical protein SG34_006025 [Thalassomonas viridans]